MNMLFLIKKSYSTPTFFHRGGRKRWELCFLPHSTNINFHKCIIYIYLYILRYIKNSRGRTFGRLWSFFRGKKKKKTPSPFFLPQAILGLKLLIVSCNWGRKMNSYLTPTFPTSFWRRTWI
jgi:hypothetical protein